MSILAFLQCSDLLLKTLQFTISIRKPCVRTRTATILASTDVWTFRGTMTDVSQILREAEQLRRAGRTKDAETLLSRAIGRPERERAQLPPLLVTLAIIIIDGDEGDGRFDRALDHLKQALAITCDEDDTTRRGAVVYHLAIAYWRSGNVAMARQCNEAASAHLDEFDPRRVTALSALCLELLDDTPEEARPYAHSLLHASSRLDTGQFRGAAMRLSAASLYTSCELACGGKPDPNPLQFAVDLVRRDFPKLRIPDEILANLAHAHAKSPPNEPNDSEPG